MWSKNQLKQQNNVNTIALLGSGQVPSIKGDEIIENMSGYSYSDYTSDETCSVTPIYVGVVKNGNKVSFVVFGRITRKDTITGRPILGKITMPKAVMDKLYPTTLFGESLLMAENYPVTNESNGSATGTLLLVRKDGTTNITLLIGTSSANNLTLNQAYLFRIEKTFLLSDNLVPSE